MTKYQVKFIYSNGEEETEENIYETEDEAREAGDYGCSCYHEGGEILHMHNPGDYPLNEDDDIDYEIIEVDFLTMYSTNIDHAIFTHGRFPFWQIYKGESKWRQAFENEKLSFSQFNCPASFCIFLNSCSCMKSIAIIMIK